MAIDQAFEAGERGKRDTGGSNGDDRRLHIRPNAPPVNSGTIRAHA